MTWAGIRENMAPQQKYSLLAESFFGSFMFIQLLAVSILTPAYVASSIADEKERKTLEFMLATDLRNREIVLSKLFSRLANLTLFILTGLPILSILQFLGGGPRSREALIKHLKLDVRGFYRDLELLRAAHIAVTLTERRYTLGERVENAIARLPFPDPRLTLGDALQLAKGRGPAHRKLKEQISEITG